MLRAHALHAVRQEEGEVRLAHPLLLSAGDEEIDHALGAVGKVAELGLPDDKGVGVGHRVAHLEAHDGVLGEGAIADSEGCLVRRAVLQGDMHSLVNVL